MSSRGPYRRHSAQFKLQLCHDIRSGALGRRGETPHSQKEAQRSRDAHGVGAAYAPRRRTLPGRASVIKASRITAVPLTKT